MHMSNVERDFSRSQVTKRITMVLMLVGVLASLALAFPGMIGLNYALADGTTLFFFVPFVVCFALAKLVERLRT